jgi:hypothetical protein
MKKIITAFIFCFSCGECFSQAGEWVWIKGDSIPNQPGNYGVQGVPSPTNNPPSLYEPCEWTDLNGNFWMFGGLDENVNKRGDLWKYEIAINEWTWMKGSGIPNDPGNYGITGIPSISNNPAARSYGVTSSIDTLGNLWMFGGLTSSGGSSSDLWKYEIATNEWTWMKGPNIAGQPGIYGILGVADPSNKPVSRAETAIAWTDNLGDLWLFGGLTGADENLNDLWKYNIASNQWTWMKGDSTLNSLGHYGIKGIEDSINAPGSRAAYSHWKDAIGNFWLLGGDRIYNSTFSNLVNLNDLWQFNPVTKHWTWISGDSIGNTSNVYGTKCIASSINSPSGRYENRASWIDQHNNLWMFGGRNYPTTWNGNDLWKYCVQANQWIWISGDASANPGGNRGSLGIPSPLNKPNGRCGSIGWSENNVIYLFGGWHILGNDNYNDLWKYTIDTTCGVCPAPNSIQENYFTNELLVFPNPTNSSLTISYSSSEKQTVELRIYNTLGQLQLFQSFETLEKVFKKEINVEKWSEGIYFLQVKMKDGVMSKKVVVQH